VTAGFAAQYLEKFIELQYATFAAKISLKRKL
jgi:hypothetical protein